MAQGAIAGFFILVVIGGVGLGVASADSPDDVERAGSFGFNNAAHVATSAYEARAVPPRNQELAYYERSALATATFRDIESGMQLIGDMEHADRERAIEEDAAALRRMAAEKARQGVDTAPEVIDGAAPQPDAVEYGLPAVDWSIGKSAFVAEWSARIDAYLDGSPLAGYGEAFAQAAWDNGVDPRWSPAISNTESGKGSACFRPCNAWGWGNSGWGDWETAIRAHIEGLARGYGYSITPDAAQTYCPPTWESWYGKTLDQMSII